MNGNVNIYQSAGDFIRSLTLVKVWPDIETVLVRAIQQEPRDWKLPLVACEAVGGLPESVVPALAAIACAHISLILIDDMLDSDPRGEHNRLGMPLTANLATTFQNLALEAAGQGMWLSPAARLAVFRNLHAMMLKTAVGQYLDIQNKADETTYWRIVQAKSAPFFESAFFVGALAGGAPEALARQLGQLGLLYGEMIQIHDDLSDSLASPASPDWLQGRWPLPLLYARVVDHPDRTRFLALRQSLPDPQALAEAQTILIRCGAVSYGIHELLGRYRKSQTLLQALPIARPEGLAALLEGQVEPIRQIFVALGERPPVN